MKNLNTKIHLFKINLIFFTFFLIFKIFSMKILTLFLVLTLSITSGFAQTTAAPQPPARNAADVISIYGEAYTNIAGVNTNPNWGQSTVVTEVNIAGNKALQYTNFNYQGTDWAGTPQNIAAMEFLHVDVWTNNQSPNVFVISSGVEIAHPISSQPGSWKSVDIPVAGITGNLSSAIQFKFDGGSGGTIVLDNLYFWKKPVAPGTDASLSDLKVDGSTVSGFASNTTSYTVGRLIGSPLPKITAATTTDTAATTVITNATAVPGNAKVEVTSKNGTVKRTYTISYIFAGPSTAAPVPPNRNASDVISIFSNSYKNVNIDAFSAVWDDSDVEDVKIAGNDTKKITFGNFLGIDFSTPGNHLNLSAMTRFHMDFFTETPSVIGKVFNSKFVDFGGTAAEKSAGELNINDGTNPAVVSGQWISIDVPITIGPWTNNITRTDVAQFVISSNLKEVYVDNIYFYKPGTVNTDDSVLKQDRVKVFPNPVKSGDFLKYEGDIQNGEIYDIRGVKVLSLDNSNSTDILLDKGVYILKVKTASGEFITKKLIIQ
ncbi:MAG: T9SS type A sorting domain-containing protein [Saprospiraceae bacterium]|nr:T9SS type A sorting domain-containing protein [Saprospiraceae bacterium]